LFQKKAAAGINHEQRSSTLMDARPHRLRIFYGTQTGTAKLFAERLSGEAEKRGITVTLADLKDCDPEECLTQQVDLPIRAYGKLKDLRENLR
jgi:sulfite reductase alpha subunit-like flavoprotein